LPGRGPEQAANAPDRDFIGAISSARFHRRGFTGAIHPWVPRGALDVTPPA
jgi:hypothetical protein